MEYIEIIAINNLQIAKVYYSFIFISSVVYCKKQAKNGQSHKLKAITLIPIKSQIIKKKEPGFII